MEERRVTHASVAANALCQSAARRPAIDFLLCACTDGVDIQLDPKPRGTAGYLLVERLAEHVPPLCAPGIAPGLAMGCNVIFTPPCIHIFH